MIGITKLELLFKAALVHPVLMIGARRLVQLGSCLLRASHKFYRTTMSSLLVPPPAVRGQNKLDCEAFRIKLKDVPYVHLPTKSLSKFKGKLKDILLKLPKFKPVQPSDQYEGESHIYLDPCKVKEIQNKLKEDLSWDETYGTQDLEVTYENWPSFNVLRAILPEDVETPTSYSLIGHIVHLNLRDEQLPYKDVIGQVLLDKIPNAKTVVNKVDGIDSTYRNFAMEILAGEQNTTVSVKEYDCTYHFDFSKVYWNPRLSTEHRALVNYLKKGDVLYDIFAGVGPFVIPAARKGVKVLANDLNPESYKWLLKNAEANKVTKLVTVFNKDGRDFLRDDVKKDILDRRDKDSPGSEHMAMNLPALAVEFLDVFSEWLNAEEIEKVSLKPPTVHVYCFIKAGKNEDFEALTKQLVEEKLGAKLSEKVLIKIHHVRNVAPNKEMMRASFMLTKEILGGEEPAKKKLKLNNDNMDDNVTGKNGKEQVKGKETAAI